MIMLPTNVSNVDLGVLRVLMETHVSIVPMLLT